jgi:hypothetical protein
MLSEGPHMLSTLAFQFAYGDLGSGDRTGKGRALRREQFAYKVCILDEVALNSLETLAEA